ncbi:hypothetical protein AAC387_Pa10g0422 [Persea americana]
MHVKKSFGIGSSNDSTLSFNYDDIVMATGDFFYDMVIGKGGFGVVYRGVLQDGRKVTVKKLQREGSEVERIQDRDAGVK